MGGVTRFSPIHPVNNLLLLRFRWCMGNGDSCGFGGFNFGKIREYDGCKGGNGGGNRGGGEGNYVSSLGGDEGGIGGVDDACIIVVDGTGRYMGGGRGHCGVRRNGGVLIGDVGEWYCYRLPQEFGEYYFKFSVFLLFGLERKG